MRGSTMWPDTTHYTILAVVVSLYTLPPCCSTADYTLGMDSETSCTKTHYYEAGDVFTASAAGMVHGGHCPLTFIQSSTWRTDADRNPCLSLCIKILSYTMESCQVKMSYHDGLNDFTPVTFDCHTFPPVMWCSSKNDLKVTVSEQQNYHGENYAITLKVEPFCGQYEHSTTDTSVVVRPQNKPSSMNQTAVIIGAIVGTISILFVCGWLVYCYRKRQPDHTSSGGTTDTRTDRNTRGSTPSQQATRYAPVDKNLPTSSQSSSDRAPGGQYKADLNIDPSTTEARLYSAFQPPVPTNRAVPYTTTDPITQKPLYSDIDRGPAGDKWYPLSQIGPNNAEMPPPPSAFNSTPTANQPSQFTYKYPQFNHQDGEMHTAPTDTRYVVYDFDYPHPSERKYSGGKGSLHNASPVKEMVEGRGLQPRAISPSRDPARLLPTMEASTTETDSALSDTTGDDTTDDQASPARRYNFVPTYGYYSHGVPPPQPGPGSVFYDPRSFQRIDQARNLSHDPRDINSQGNPRTPATATIPCGANTVSDRTDHDIPDTDDPSPGQTDGRSRATPAREQPMPQVPPIPRDFQRTPSEPPEQRHWPHTRSPPPPPYSQEERGYMV